MKKISEKLLSNIEIKGARAIDPAYGIPMPKSEKSIFIENMINVCKIFIIPAILVIGLFIYLKKSKSNKKTKIFISIEVICIAVVLYFIMLYLNI